MRKIINAAAREFAEKGFAGARVDQIARAARVNKATLYYHVGGKEALYMAVLRDVVGSIADQIDERWKMAPGPEEKFRAFVATIADNILSSKYFSPIILREIASGGANMPEEILSLMGRIVTALRSVLSEGVAEGKFTETPPIIVHLLIVGGLNFLAANNLFGRIKSERFVPDDLLSENAAGMAGERIAEILLHGLVRGK